MCLCEKVCALLNETRNLGGELTGDGTGSRSFSWVRYKKVLRNAE